MTETNKNFVLIRPTVNIPKETKLSLKAKEEIAKIVIADALYNFSRPTVVWSTGKDSTVVLHMVKDVVDKLNLKMPTALFVDHGDHYKETLQMLEDIGRSWKLNIVIARNEDVLRNVKNGVVTVSDLSEENQGEVRRIGFNKGSFEYSLESDVGNHLLKTVALNSAILQYRFDALFTGIRWDENPARGNEVFISQRDEPPHFRIQPILPFLERDVWNYMLANKLPVHPKYREGYRSIDGVRDSKKVSDEPAWEQDMEHTREREGRSQDKEGMMERLRQLGYM